MMRYFAALLFAAVCSHASLLDFRYLDRAAEAYAGKRYDEAYRNYSRVKSDEALFNAADSLYRQKKYEEALKLFEKIKEKKLQHKRLHNMGNCYANMNRIDEAIKAYENALRIEEDKDTRYNLELLKRKKKQQQKKEKNKNKNKNSGKKQKNNSKNNQKNNSQDNRSSGKSADRNKGADQKSNKNGKNGDRNKKESGTEKEKKKSAGQKDKDQKNGSTGEKKKRDRNSGEKEKREKTGQKSMTGVQAQPPISDMEEKKWQKMLNGRGVNTLMLPVGNPKGGKRDEQNPW